MEWAAHAGDESGDVLCTRTGKNTYVIRSLCSTVLDGLCEVAHDQDAWSDALCIRRHPHDTTVEFHMTIPALKAALSEMRTRMEGVRVCENANTNNCTADCPSFWTASHLRRSLWNTIHVVACSSVRIITNTSNYEDEQIAHRCGQLAIQGEAIEAAANS